VIAFARSIGLEPVDTIKSPITGAAGNQEFLAHFRWKPKNQEIPPAVACGER
jgi:predicted rRNA methylase YqxC with S4 and FtsJ domains